MTKALAEPVQNLLLDSLEGFESTTLDCVMLTAANCLKLNQDCPYLEGIEIRTYLVHRQLCRMTKTGQPSPLLDDVELAKIAHECGKFIRCDEPRIQSLERWIEQTWTNLVLVRNAHGDVEEAVKFITGWEHFLLNRKMAMAA